VLAAWCETRLDAEPLSSPEAEEDRVFLHANEQGRCAAAARKARSALTTKRRVDFLRSYSWLCLDFGRCPRFLDDTKLADNELIDLETPDSGATD
jgi:hypothetical protein